MKYVYMVAALGEGAFIDRAVTLDRDQIIRLLDDALFESIDGRARCVAKVNELLMQKSDEELSRLAEHGHNIESGTFGSLRLFVIPIWEAA